MVFPDDPDDDAGFIPPLPQEDRLWRHPSEMGSSSITSTSPDRRRMARSGPIALLLIGVFATGLIVAGLRSIESTDSNSRGTDLAIGPAATEVSETALAALAPSVVQILIDGPSSSSAVTGLMIRPDGHVVTAADPLDDARSLTVVMADGRSYNAVVVGTDPVDDLAVIDIEGTGLPVPEFGDISTIDQGDRVFVVGRTDDDRRAWVATATFQSSGLRMDTSDGHSLHDMIGSTSASKVPTMSAILCSSSGQVIGLVTSRSARTPQVTAFAGTSSSLLLPDPVTTFAHPIAWTTRIADELIDSGTVHHAWLGVVTTDSNEGGARIDAVVSPSPAALAQIEAGDRITSLDDARVRTSSDLVVALRRYSPSDSIRLSVIRGDSTLEIIARLSDRS